MTPAWADRTEASSAPQAEQRWSAYARSALAFSLMSIVFLHGLQRLQHHLWGNLGFADVPAPLAWNTAVSFVTNTNWQANSGESTVGHVVQTGGLAVQNFVSAAVGMAVAVALVRGVVRILLPIATVGAVALAGGGVIQSFGDHHSWTTVTGGTQTFTPAGAAAQEAIKELGTNGGGIFNANSAHPFENPTAWTNWIEIFLLLVIAFSLPRTFGRMVGDNRQGYAIVAVMATIALASVGLTLWGELAAQNTVPQALGASMEGREARFGVPDSSIFGTATWRNPVMLFVGIGAAYTTGRSQSPTPRSSRSRLRSGSG